MKMANLQRKVPQSRVSLQGTVLLTIFNIFKKIVKTQKKVLLKDLQFLSFQNYFLANFVIDINANITFTFAFLISKSIAFAKEIFHIPFQVVETDIYDFFFRFELGRSFRLVKYSDNIVAVSIGSMEPVDFKIQNKQCFKSYNNFDS